jgi:hypothetical protein
MAPPRMYPDDDPYLADASHQVALSNLVNAAENAYPASVIGGESEQGSTAG